MIEFSPPYWAWKSATGHWHVMNSKGDHELACDCRRHAEELATELNEHAYRERGCHCGILDRFELPGNEDQHETEN